VVHHGSLARVDRIGQRALMFNLLALFWVTLLPFAAENAADRPLDPLGPSLLALCCGAYLLSYIGFRFNVHSTIDDLADMLSCVVDGAIIMSKSLNDPSRLERQILMFRSCVKLMFAAPSLS